MKQKLKYIELFEGYPKPHLNIDNHELNKFLRNNTEYTVIYEDENDIDDMHVFNVDRSSYNQNVILEYNPIQKPTNYDNYDDDEHQYKDVMFRVFDMKEYKWSETPLGQFDFISIINNYLNVEFQIENNTKLSEIDGFDIRYSDGINLYIENNPLLEYIEIDTDDIWHLSLEKNPILWDIKFSGVASRDVTVADCPYVFLFTIINTTNTYKFDWLYYDTDRLSITISGNDLYLEEEKLYDLAIEELFAVQDYNEPVYEYLLPKMTEFIINYSDENKLNQFFEYVYENNGKENLYTLKGNTEFYSKVPDVVKYLFDPEYKNTGAKSVAKVATGVTYGLF